MGRFHNALQQLARRGYFAMEPNEPIVHDVLARNVNKQAPMNPPTGHPIEVAAALPQLHVGAPRAARLENDTLVELSGLDHGDDQAMTPFAPIVIDAGLRRWQFRSKSPSVRSEQSWSDDSPPESSADETDSVSPKGRTEQISDESDLVTHDEKSNDRQQLSSTSVGDADANTAAPKPTDSTDSTAMPETVTTESVAADGEGLIVAELADGDSHLDHFERRLSDRTIQSPYSPVLDRWAVFPDHQDPLPAEDDVHKQRSTIEPIRASSESEVPPSRAGDVTDTPGLQEQGDEADPTSKETAGSVPASPTEFEFEIAERLRTPSYLERIEKISDAISKDSMSGGPRIVLFVSMDADNQRARAATALALYRCHLRTLPTLLVDADIDSRHVSRGYHRNDAGLIEAISGQLPWSNSVRPTSTENLCLLPCGADLSFVSPDSEQEEFQQIAQFAAQWREQYGLVLIDGGLIDSPLVPVLTRVSDATFVYVQLGKSRLEELAAAIGRLEKAGGNIQGCITTGPTT